MHLRWSSDATSSAALHSEEQDNSLQLPCHMDSMEQSTLFFNVLDGHLQLSGLPL